MTTPFVEYAHGIPDTCRFDLKCALLSAAALQYDHPWMAVVYVLREVDLEPDTDFPPASCGRLTGDQLTVVAVVQIKARITWGARKATLKPTSDTPAIRGG